LPAFPSLIEGKDSFFEQRSGTPPRDFKEANITTDDAKTAIDAGVNPSTSAVQPCLVAHL
jgi:hypothetical protein